MLYEAQRRSWRARIENLTAWAAPSHGGQARSELRWGLVGVGIVVVLALLAGLLYVWQPGTRDVTAQFAEAGQIRVGDSVRVAGVSVGTVRSVTLRDDHVDVTMAVDRDAALGDQTTADVRMLTIVGGNYINLSSSGGAALGSSVIPVQRTSFPYSLIQTFQLAQPKLEKLDATPIRELLTQTTRGLEQNPGAIKRNLDTLTSMLTNLNNRQDEFGTTLRVAADYTKRLNVSGDVLTQLARNISSFMSDYALFGARFGYVLGQLGEMLARVRSLAHVYRFDVQPLVDKVDAIGRQFGPELERYTPMINQARDLIQRLEGMVAPDGTVHVDQSGIVLSSDFCVPAVGVVC